MTVNVEQEDAIIAFVSSYPDDHFVLPEPGIPLVTRDGCRVSLHRRLYQRVVGNDLLSHEYLLNVCGERNCLNPRHYRVSITPYLDVVKCRNGHRYTEKDLRPDGSYRCHVCAAQRAARRPARGGEPHWMQEKRRRFCPHGHEYSRDNTYIYPTKSGGQRRQCKTCTRLRAAGIDPSVSSRE